MHLTDGLGYECLSRTELNVSAVLPQFVFVLTLDLQLSANIVVTNLSPDELPYYPISPPPNALQQVSKVSSHSLNPVVIAHRSPIQR